MGYIGRVLIAALMMVAVVVRVVGRGELVPASAVGDARDLDLRPVSVTLEPCCFTDFSDQPGGRLVGRRLALSG